MGLAFNYIPWQTPLDDDEKDGLLIQTIATRGELDEFEQQNIEQAIQWTLTRKFKQEEIFTEHFIKDVHKRMYNDVWGWAGEFRRTNKNIGVDKWQIPIELRKLLEDVPRWINSQDYGPDEVAIMFKHRIVSIHCFQNGNGRHSRLIADIVIEKIFNRAIFSWGAAANLSNESDSRKNYLTAIRTADKGDYTSLVAFARS